MTDPIPDAQVVCETLYDKIKTLNEKLWEQRAPRPTVDRWLTNFFDDLDKTPSERLHALFLLSQFIYFGDREVRELLRSLYRDQYRYPIVAQLRRDNGDESDAAEINRLFDAELARTRFLGVGNPSESGTHLLYFFRQENKLPKDAFASLAELVDRRLDDPAVTLDDPDVRRLVFVDDLCGSGNQAIAYSQKVLPVLRAIQARNGITLTISYLVLAARLDALARVEAATDFDEVSTVLELDDTHKALSDESRHFRDPPTGIARPFAHTVARKYGSAMMPAHPLGYLDGQLLLGFHHNVPDNTLPIIWWDEPTPAWEPIFRRYPKLYG